MKQPIFALIDCNNFFVSCERLFRPDLEDRPVVVLSSNDGCAVSRSAEAKALGIPMGAPAFKYRDLFQKHGVVCFSANFELYGNISRRITTLLTSITPRIEIYSVDESFLDISSLPITDYEAWGKQIRQHILDWVGIPVSVGIAPSKTLAKLANLQAKKQPDLGGSLSFVKSRENREKSEFSHLNVQGQILESGVMRLDREKTNHYLALTSVADVWGIGWRLAPKLRAAGVGTAYAMAQLAPRQAGQLMGVAGKQIVAELNGTCCHPLTLEGKLPQSIASTRTFGEDTNDPHVIEAALATFVATASFKLRRSQQLTQRVMLFAATSKYKPGYNSWYQEISLQQPTADTGQLIQAVCAAFRAFYNPRVMYHRAGITLHDFVPDSQLQTDILGAVDTAVHDKSKSRMTAIDSLNNKHGKRTVRFASEVLASQWQPKHQLRSPRFVSQWSELPRVSGYREG